MRFLNQNIELLGVLVSKELKVRYKNSFLGYIWAIANPFAFAIVYYMAFKVIMRVEMENYSIFLLSGMFPWMWLSNSLHHATGSYRNNKSLIKHVSLTRAVLPLSNVVHEMVHFCFALPVLGLFIVIAGGELFISWVWQLPILIALQLILIYPLGLIFALSNVFVHDVEYLIGISLAMLFFLTPIVYPLSMVPNEYRIYFDISPLAALIESWRGVLLNGEFRITEMLVVLLAALVAGALSYYLYKVTHAKIGELL